jgi:hypothetical protein
MKDVLYYITMSTILCESCGLAFTRKDNLTRHQSNCKGNPLVDKLRKEIQDLQDEVKKLKHQLTIANTQNHNSGHVNNTSNAANTINNTTNNNITIVLNFTQPNLDCFKNDTKEMVSRVRSKQSIPQVFLELFDFIYRNPKYPENHSIKFEDGEIKIMKDGWEISSAGKVVTVSLDKIKEGMQILEDLFPNGEVGTLYDDDCGIKDTDAVDRVAELIKEENPAKLKLPMFLRKHLEAKK